MKIKSSLFLGFSFIALLSIIFGIVSYQNESSLDAISQYHLNMGIPATNSLQEIKSAYFETEAFAFEYILGLDSAKQEFLNAKMKTKSHIEKYKELIDITDKNGNYLAPESMKTSMQDIVFDLDGSSDILFSYFDQLHTNYEGGNSEDNDALIESIENEEDEFLTIVNNALIMETNGFMNKQIESAQIIENSLINAILFPTILTSVILLLGFIISKYIIIPLKNANKKLEDNDIIINYQIEKIKEIDRMKEEFITMISHELKNPLAPIQMWCDALMESGMLGELNDEQKNAVKKISLSTTDLQRLVNDIFDTYKLELGKIKFDKKELNSKDIIKEVIENSSSILIKKNVQVIDISKTNHILFGDDTRIVQILNNLIKNASRYVDKDNGKIEINCFEKSNFIRFEVIDNGVGIKEELQQYIFKKFYQIESTDLEKMGTGLGLTICEGLVRGLGGEIGVESVIGKGSTFYFTIPKIEVPNVISSI